MATLGWTPCAASRLARVTQLVQRALADARPVAELVEGSGKTARLQRRPDPRGEHEVMIFPTVPGTKPLLCLSDLVPAQALTHEAGSGTVRRLAAALGSAKIIRPSTRTRARLGKSRVRRVTVDAPGNEARDDSSRRELSCPILLRGAA